MSTQSRSDANRHVYDEIHCEGREAVLRWSLLGRGNEKKERKTEGKRRVLAALLSGMHQSRTRYSIDQRKLRKKGGKCRKVRGCTYCLSSPLSTLHSPRKRMDRKKGREGEGRTLACLSRTKKRVLADAPQQHLPLFELPVPHPRSAGAVIRSRLVLWETPNGLGEPHLSQWAIGQRATEFWAMLPTFVAHAGIWA